VKIRKVEENLPKELIREIETIESLPKEEPGLNPSYIVDIEEVFLGKTSLNIVYSPYCSAGDLHQYLNSEHKNVEVNIKIKHVYALFY